MEKLSSLSPSPIAPFLGELISLILAEKELVLEMEIQEEAI